MDNKSESCGFCPDGFKTFLFHRIKDVEDRALIDNVITEIKDIQTKLQDIDVQLEDYLEMNGAEGGVIRTQHERDFYKQKYESLYIKQ